MDDLKQIIASLCKSEYLDEWILRLKENPVLFSPERNIKPCERIDNQYVKSSYWEALNLLEVYCKRNLDNDEVDTFIVELLNKSIALYKNDTESDPYKRLNSSNAIITELFEICVLKKRFFDSVDVALLAKESFESVTAWPFSVVYALHQKKHVLVECLPTKVFEVYKTIFDFGGKAIDYDDYFDIDELVAKAPYKYYEYCKEQIATYDFTISSMGSFYEYDSGGYEKEKEAIIFKVFKSSSKGIDLAILEKDIEQYILSNNKLFKKIGLCLININFNKTKNLFFDHIDLFLGDNVFYSDLRCLLSNNLSNINEEKSERNLLKEKLQAADFGLSNKTALNILKNYLFKLCSQNGLDIPFIEPTKADITFVMNYNKSFYIVDHDFEGDIDSIKNKIRNLSINQSVEVYNSLIKGSGYFTDTVRRAFIETYFVEERSVKYLSLFDYELAISLIHYHQNNKNTSALYETISEVLMMCRTDPSYIDCMSSVLFAIQSSYESMGKEKYSNVLRLIDYKWITIDEFKYEKEIISECINENMHTFLELVTYAVDVDIMPFDYLKEIISFYIGKYNTSKFKAVLAFVFPRLLRINSDYASSLIDIVFNNGYKDTNPSYCLLAISHGYSPQLLETFSERTDLRVYLSGNVNSSDERMAKTVIFNWFLAGHLYGKDYGEILDIAFNNKRFDAILENLRSINYWLEEGQIKDNVKLTSYFAKFFASIDETLNSYAERDQIIREVSSIIVLTDGLIDESWKTLIKLFDYFSHFFSDESVELVKRFKDTKKEYIIQILNKYFNSYEQFQTYEDTLRKVFEIVAFDEMYRNEIKRWQVCISKKNPDFAF